MCAIFYRLLSIRNVKKTPQNVQISMFLVVFTGQIRLGYLPKLAITVTGQMTADCYGMALASYCYDTSFSILSPFHIMCSIT